jgi:hypothetical protein
MLRSHYRIAGQVRDDLRARRTEGKAAAQDRLPARRVQSRRRASLRVRDILHPFWYRF